MIWEGVSKEEHICLQRIFLLLADTAKGHGRAGNNIRMPSIILLHALPSNSSVLKLPRRSSRAGFSGASKGRSILGGLPSQVAEL